MRRFCVIAFLCTLWITLPAGAQTVVKTVTLANHVEASTYIPSGPHASSVAFISDFDVKAIAGMGRSQHVETLFNTLGLPLRFMARGITYMEAERRFAFTNNLDGTVLYLTDEHGALQETLHVTWPTGQELPNYVESVVWVGAGDPHFANHFLMVVMFPDMPVRIATIRRDGTLDGFIAPSVDSGYATGLAYVGQNQLLLTDLDNNLILVMDVQGNVQQTINPSPDNEVEGITPLPNGNIALFPGNTGQMVMMDRNFRMIPSLTRDFSVGVGLLPCRGVGWNTDAAEFVGSCLTYDGSTSGLWNISADGTQKQELVDYSSFPGLPPFANPVFLPDQHLIATVHMPSPRGIQFYTATGQDAGSYAINYGPLESYIPTTGQMVGSMGATGLTFFDARTGASQQSIDLAPLGVTNITGVTYFTSNGQDRLLVFDGPSELAWVLKLDGTMVSSFNYVVALGTPACNSLAPIDSGPYAGNLMLFNADPVQVVIFHMN